MNPTLEKKLESDVNYIKKELITKQPNGNYMKFSRIGNFLTMVNESKDKYIRYWEAQYKKQGSKDDLGHTYSTEDMNEACKVIQKTLIEKFDTGLISNKEMIDLINSAKWEPERDKALGYLKEKVTKQD